MLLKWLLKRELKDCEFQILSLATELEYTNSTPEKQVPKLLVAHSYESARKEALLYVLKYVN